MNSPAQTCLFKLNTLHHYPQPLSAHFAHPLSNSQYKDTEKQKLNRISIDSPASRIPMNEKIVGKAVLSIEGH